MSLNIEFLKGKDMQNKNVNQAYKSAKFDISNLLGWFECEMGKEPEKIDWACVGSLNEVRKDLIQTLAFCSGISEKQIQESLEELNNVNIDEIFENLNNAPQPDWKAVTKDFRRHATENENE